MNGVLHDKQESPPIASLKKKEAKLSLACMFCRRLHLACSCPLPGSKHRMWDQCQCRSLKCEFPSESRREMRKKGATAKVNPDGRRVTGHLRYPQQPEGKGFCRTGRLLSKITAKGTPRSRRAPSEAAALAPRIKLFRFPPSRIRECRLDANDERLPGHAILVRQAISASDGVVLAEKLAIMRMSVSKIYVPCPTSSRLRLRESQADVTRFTVSYAATTSQLIVKSLLRTGIPQQHKDKDNEKYNRSQVRFRVDVDVDPSLFAYRAMACGFTEAVVRAKE
ncbi:hypothetical protein BDN71DRAFT_1435959 [Pleurotus eryngii]|uniref:Uncharacterized protein n=1 Tax=Pleurotus eryngii TaxID=5323 RepID=A0A9P5ZL91_PLEER|nr:hypothetical protein BDN71DRAFT_1435959 [Pleurotus eryngii]